MDKQVRFPSVAQSLVFAYLFIFVYLIKIHSVWISLSGIQGIFGLISSVVTTDLLLWGYINVYIYIK